MAASDTNTDSPLVSPAGCSVDPATKACSSCGNAYAATREHFPKDGNVCRACHRTNRTKQRERKRARRRIALDQIEESGLELYATLAQAGGSNIPHSAEVLERIFQYFGGVGGFSAMLVKQYYDSPPGGSTRSKLLETVVRLVTKNVEAGGAKKPLTMWTEEELEAELDQRFQQALNTYRGVTVNATPKALEAPAAEGGADHTDAQDASPESHAVPEGRDQDDPSGTAGAEAGGSAALQANTAPTEDARVPRSRSSRDRRQPER